MYTERTDIQTIVQRTRIVGLIIVIVSILSIGANVLGFLTYIG